jgi:hypothetical protein
VIGRLFSGYLIGQTFSAACVVKGHIAAAVIVVVILLYVARFATVSLFRISTFNVFTKILSTLDMYLH